LTKCIIKNGAKINWIIYIHTFLNMYILFSIFNRETTRTQQELMVTTSSPLYCMHTKCKVIGR
jgi:hypothetical protein